MPSENSYKLDHMPSWLKKAMRSIGETELKGAFVDHWGSYFRNGIRVFCTQPYDPMSQVGKDELDKDAAAFAEKIGAKLKIVRPGPYKETCVLYEFSKGEPLEEDPVVLARRMGITEDQAERLLKEKASLVVETRKRQLSPNSRSLEQLAQDRASVVALFPPRHWMVEQICRIMAAAASGTGILPSEIPSDVSDAYIEEAMEFARDITETLLFEVSGACSQLEKWASAYEKLAGRNQQEDEKLDKLGGFFPQSEKNVTFEGDAFEQVCKEIWWSLEKLRGFEARPDGISVLDKKALADLKAAAAALINARRRAEPQNSQES